MKRRTFIKTAAGTGLATGAGVFGILKYPRGANAAGWGTWPTDRADLMIPEELRPQSVLELNFHGGITPWETFYSIPEWGQGNYTYLNLFEDSAVANRSSTFYANCGYGGTDYVTPFADAGGRGCTRSSSAPTSSAACASWCSRTRCSPTRAPTR